MKIKRVEIVGFKSFVDKVAIDFQDGVIAIVGPNGCGKSNIVDAIRWVMGEQSARNLRGRAMEDVIFGGSESRRPHGMAEVSMLFSNEDGLGPPAFREYAEIMVTRRLFRNGESEYALNKTPCRLLDISELFMDTGVGARAYSIIEQGKIGMILNAKPEDRRFLIEEAAGVTKFKSRKKTALRKIEATRQNLLRLGDIITEVRRQSANLKRQARKAERFREYREELRGIETRVAAERYRELQAAVGESAARETALQQTAADQEIRLQEAELLLSGSRLRQVADEKELKAAQERAFHLTSQLQKVEAQIEIGVRDLENGRRQHERLHTETAESAGRLAELDREEEQLRQDQGSLGVELARQTGLLALAEGRLAELNQRETGQLAALEAARSRLYAILTELTRLGSQQEEAQRRLQSLEHRTARSHAEALNLREQLDANRREGDALAALLDGYQQRRHDLERERAAGQEGLRRLRQAVDENEATLLVRREEHQRVQSRLESLRELERNLEGYGSGVKLLLGSPEYRTRFEGLVADAIEVPARYEVAVEAVLGERLQALLAPQPAVARDTFAFLRQQEGRCSFLLPGFAPAAATEVPGGTLLASLLQFRGQASSALRGLFAATWLVPDLEPFCAGGLPAGATLVTEAGETLTACGELTGGAQTALGQGLLHKKREMKELASQTEVLATAVAALQQERLELRDAFTRAEQALRDAEAALHRKELKVIDNEKDLTRLRGERQRLEERLEVLSLEETQLHEEHEELQTQLSGAAQGRAEREILKAAAHDQVAQLQEELQGLHRATAAGRDEVTALKMAVVGLGEREDGSRRGLDRLTQLRIELGGRIALLRSRQEEGEAEGQRLQDEIEKHRVELGRLYYLREEEKAQLDQLNEGFAKLSGDISAQEEEIKTLHSRISLTREELMTRQLGGREWQMEADHLRQRILDRYRVDLADLPPAAAGIFERTATEERLIALRSLIDELGEVNLMAIDEYRELEERNLFLSTQQEDLRQSLNDLQAAIARINRTTRARFREAFDQVNGKFREIFPRLFRGGQAELRLTDEGDLLETGIDIIAQPPGKKLQNVSLLSGGEKALTAVALIFSIFLIKPSPFCLLDEVDAPLDDANIGRFNEMVREMADHSQFIIITHSKRTMEMADALYGVTMEEPGVSKLVSVRINEF
jgi:chromosome segregation protein